MSTTIRVSEATRDRFAALAKSTGKPMTDLLDQAVTTLERELFFKSIEERYESLRGSDDGAWAEISVERSLEASALHDSSR
jgi:predicted transcriptional regulator